MADIKDLKVGSTVWINGKPYVICGETRVSWQIKINRWDRKLTTFPKRPSDPSRIMASEHRKRYGGSRVWLDGEAYRDEVWRRSNHHRIGQAISGCDTSTLRKIAEMIGYQEQKQK